jgi:hypothetical protein
MIENVRLPQGQDERRGGPETPFGRVSRLDAKGGSKLLARGSVVQHNVQKGAVDLQPAVFSAGIVNEPPLPEAVHEKADAH